MKDKINNFVACKIKNYVNKLKLIYLIFIKLLFFVTILRYIKKYPLLNFI